MSEQAPALVIVTGHPGTGKTSLARRLAQDLALPLFCKDDIKESLFDTLGWRDRAWSQQLGRAVYPLLFRIIEAQLGAGQPCLVESNFHPDMAAPEFLALRGRYEFRALQIHLFAQGSVLVERYRNRAGSAERHPGHVDSLPDVQAAIEPVLLSGRLGTLDIGGQIIEIETTDFAAVDYQAVLARTQEFVLGTHARAHLKMAQDG